MNVSKMSHRLNKESEQQAKTREERSKCPSRGIALRALKEIDKQEEQLILSTSRNPTHHHIQQWPGSLGSTITAMLKAL